MELSITLIIIIITTLVSIGGFSNQRLVDDLIFYPPAVNRGQWYRFFSCGLIHADVGHLIFNMYALYIFGAGTYYEQYDYHTGVEYDFIRVFGNNGKWIYLAMYLTALAASIIPTYVKNRNNYHYRSLGASGAVSAVVFAKIMFDPISGLGLFFIPVFIAGFIFGAIYLLISAWLDRKGGDNINHSAHIFGAIFGVGFTIIACQVFYNFPILTNFIEEIKNTNPGDLIKFGRG